SIHIRGFICSGNLGKWYNSARTLRNRSGANTLSLITATPKHLQLLQLSALEARSRVGLLNIYI
ncbi:hypothetical protein, partial [Microcoleus sp. herbarium14]|uniref:hypothetical protein n=1 Tax=Microcoleus sp. herbarium14 TaxID=3055439 RepID=UPI002FD29AD8